MDLPFHVFEQMGKSGPAFLFVSRTNVVINRDGYNRHSRIAIENHAESVI